MTPPNSWSDFIAKKTDSATDQSVVQHEFVLSGSAALTQVKREVSEGGRANSDGSGFSCVHANI